jgi:Effector-associated domain 5/TIR domain
MPGRLLDHATILRLSKAAINARLERDALLSQLSGTIVGALPRGRSDQDQMLMDLSSLNSAGTLRDGTVPLLVWLATAIALSDERSEQAEFEKALRAATAASQATPPPGAPPGRAAEAVPRDGAVVVFVSYAPEDKRYFDALERHLSPMIRAGAVELRHRNRPPPGEDEAAWRAASLDAAAMVVLLVSSYLLFTDDTLEEVKRARARKDAERTPLVPILVGPVDRADTHLAGLVCLPRSGPPISKRDPDEAFTEIVGELRPMLTALRASR